MNTLTLHALDSTLAEKLKAHAKRDQKSLNQAAKELLSSALGVKAAKPINRRDEFAPLCGIWTEKEGRQFEADTACFSEVDAELWK